jgi:radical SAM protein with 4Fe4S-binding SPASM domain
MRVSETMWVNPGELRDERLVEYVRNLTPKIKQLTLLPTELCNYRCKMCHVWGETGWARKEPEKAISEQLEITVLKRFIDEVLVENKNISVLLSGGEPLLYKHIVELGQYLRSKKLTTYLLTNGTLIKENIDFILNNIIGLCLSIDGPEKYHDSIRQEGSFQEICSNLEALMKEKKRLRKLFPYIQINMTISQYNYASVKDFVRELRERFKEEKIIVYDSSTNPWAKKRDIAINFQPLYFTTKEKGMGYLAQMKELGCESASGWEGFLEDDPIDIDAARLKRDLEDLWRAEGIDYSNFIDVYKYFTDINENFGKSKCIGPWHELTIRRTGDVYPCVDLPDYKIGNIYEASFKDIWEGNKLKKFREFLKKENLEMCNRCTRIWADPDAFNGLW